MSSRGSLALLLIGACASDPTGAAADAGYLAPQGQEAELCSIAPFDFGGAPSTSATCPARPPTPPAACQPGTSCQYVSSFGQLVNQVVAHCGPGNTYVTRSGTCRPACYPPTEVAIVVGGAACETREAHACPPAQPGMTRYDRLTAALEGLADGCGLSGPGTGSSVQAWFDGGCVRQLAVRTREAAPGVRDCLMQKLRSLRLDCAADFPCAGFARTLD